MNQSTLRDDADKIIKSAICSVHPHEAVCRALEGRTFSTGRVILVAVGKAAWSMARSAFDCIGDQVSEGIVITKHEHVNGAIGGLRIREAGHPVPDQDGFSATEEALALTQDLESQDTVIFLLSGGGSALFEAPMVFQSELQEITQNLLACGADIVEINTIRKRLSAVKGGRFAQHCAPAQVLSIVLSDIVGNAWDMIASGPTYPDASTCDEAWKIVKKYNLSLSEEAVSCLNEETPKALSNVESLVMGSVSELCAAASKSCQELGYHPMVLTDSLTCEAREAGAFLAAVARTHEHTQHSLAFLVGGETVVHLTGNGMGGRNQELALAAAPGITGLRETAIFSVGSDGTDGPTDAAGGFVTGETNAHLIEKGIKVFEVLRCNDAYHALDACGGLIMTGPTGTNVNDVSVLLIRRT